MRQMAGSLPHSAQMLDSSPFWFLLVIFVISLTSKFKVISTVYAKPWPLALIRLTNQQVMSLGTPRF